MAHKFAWIEFNILTTIVSSKTELHISRLSMQYEDEFGANKSKSLAHVKIWNSASYLLKKHEYPYFKKFILNWIQRGGGGGGDSAPTSYVPKTA